MSREPLDVAATALYLGMPEWKVRLLAKRGKLRLADPPRSEHGKRGRPKLWFDLTSLDKYLNG